MTRRRLRFGARAGATDLRARHRALSGQASIASSRLAHIGPGPEGTSARRNALVQRRVVGDRRADASACRCSRSRTCRSACRSWALKARTRRSRPWRGGCWTTSVRRPSGRVSQPSRGWRLPSCTSPGFRCRPRATPRRACGYVPARVRDVSRGTDARLMNGCSAIERTRDNCPRLPRTSCRTGRRSSGRSPRRCRHAEEKQGYRRSPACTASRRSASIRVFIQYGCSSLHQSAT